MKAPYFPVETETWMANIRYLEPSADGFQHGPIKIGYHNVHHPGVTYGYRIEVGGKTIIYVSDNEFSYLEGSIARRQDELSEAELEIAEQVKAEERAAELKRIEGADILIHDAQYTPEDYAQKRGWGHSCYVDTVNSAIDANVKILYLYHHDPNYPGPKDFRHPRTLPAESSGIAEQTWSAKSPAKGKPSICERRSCPGAAAA